MLKESIMKLKNINVEILIVIFFALQPILDIYKRFYQDTISIGPLAIEEIINLALVFIMLILTVIDIIVKRKTPNIEQKEKDIESTKNTKFKKIKNIFLKDTLSMYVIYVLIAVVYLLMHYINISNFNISIFESATPNFITETYYLIRTYIFPIIMIFVVYNSYFTFEKFAKLISYTVLMISLVIVVSNIFNISFISYNSENVTIDGNIFSWLSFDGSETFENYTSIGFFKSPNEMSALLLMLLPINCYLVIKEQKIHNLIFLILQVLAMCMIGTQTAILGATRNYVCYSDFIDFFTCIKARKNQENEKINSSIFINSSSINYCIL